MSDSTFDRRTQIIDAVRDAGRLSTGALSQRFGVSEVTIRNDLAALEQQGWLQRVHGGAEAPRAYQIEQSFSERRGVHAREKARLAIAAAGLVRTGDTVLLDSSTSAFQVAMQLCRTPGLRIVTNSFPAAASISECRGLEVIILGGVLRAETSSVVGPFLPHMLNTLHADWLFLSASGVTVARGLTDADTREVEAKRAMVHAARKVVAIVDSSKFGRESFLTFAALDDLDILICDGVPPAEIASACAEHDVELLIVQ